MPLDLNAARALHDRDPSDPGVCVTCSTNDRYQAWPCATALALGATGRSEWEDSRNETARCTGLDHEGEPCVLNNGHIGPHYHRYGNDTCTALPNGQPCVRPIGHTDAHLDPSNIHWGACWETDTRGTIWIPCSLDKGHTGPHSNQNGHTW